MAWGTSTVATRAALNAGVEPITLTAIRAVIATAVLVAIALATTGSLGIDLGTLRMGGVMSVFNLTLPFLLTTFALRYASAGFVGFIIALIPLTTAIVAHYLLPEEPLHWRKVVTLLIALSGVGLLVLSGDSGLADGGRPLLSAGLTFGAVAAIGYAGVYAKLHSGKYEPVPMTTVQFGLGAAMAVPIALAAEGWPEGISLWGWELILYLSVFTSVLPFLLFYWLLRHVSSTQVATIAYVVPLVGLTAGIVLLDEQLQFGIGLGGLLILTGVVLTGRAERAAVRATDPAAAGPVP